jgi:hypothetical protein
MNSKGLETETLAKYYSFGGNFLWFLDIFSLVCHFFFGNFIDLEGSDLITPVLCRSLNST